MPNNLSFVTVPNVIGMGRGQAEGVLSSVPLRFIARLVSSPTGLGSAAAQTPVAGTSVLEYAVVTVEYPNPLLDAEEPIDGPVPINGLLEGTITAVFVGKKGAGIGFSPDPSIPPFEYILYNDADQTTREGYMRRGALLALAQRAFTGKDNVRINFADKVVQVIYMFR
jgi:hypothetical protein